MDTLIDIFLPLSLAFIMFALGLGLVPADFGRVARRPLGFALGAFGQVVALPLVALGLIALFGLSGTMAVGVMILALSPGGVTSNVMTRLARGDVALSVSLTAVISLVVVVTVPLLIGPLLHLFLGQDAPAVSATQTGLRMFAIVAVPVLLGVAVRSFLSGFALRVERPAAQIATGLFILIVLGALADNWAVFTAQLPVLGPTLIALNLVMIAVGLALARLGRQGQQATTAIAIETGIQNATVGVTVANIVASQVFAGQVFAGGQGAGAQGLSELALASGVYGITMYAVALPFILWRRGLRD